MEEEEDKDMRIFTTRRSPAVVMGVHGAFWCPWPSPPPSLLPWPKCFRNFISRVRDPFWRSFCTVIRILASVILLFFYGSAPGISLVLCYDCYCCLLILAIFFLFFFSSIFNVTFGSLSFFSLCFSHHSFGSSFPFFSFFYLISYFALLPLFPLPFYISIISLLLLLLSLLLSPSPSPTLSLSLPHPFPLPSPFLLPLPFSFLSLRPPLALASLVI